MTTTSGNNSPKTKNQNIIINKHSFNFCYVIGKGGFGKVWKVQNKKTKQFFALKEMSKLKILDKKSEKSINSEREFLSSLNHPFIVNMHYAFQDNDNLYLVIDMLSGGDLRYHISRYRRFSEEQTRFFIACIVLSLDYIHSNNVIHRDIKPENLVLDDKGYVRITDFGIAKENSEDNSSETSGTPGYMSPEVMRSKNHSFPVDFFAIGVIGYEFMTGKRPYYGKNRQEIKEQMLSKQAMIKLDSLPHGWSQESADFINKLLQRKIDHRLGVNGARELMAHPWLKYYPWKELENKKLFAPFIPEKKDNFDKRYCESIDKITEETKIRYEELLIKSKFKTAFSNFLYNKDEIRTPPQPQISTRDNSHSHSNHNNSTNVQSASSSIKTSSANSVSNNTNNIISKNIDKLKERTSSIKQTLQMSASSKKIPLPQKEPNSYIQLPYNNNNNSSNSISNQNSNSKGQHYHQLNYSLSTRDVASVTNKKAKQNEMNQSDALKQSFSNAQSSTLTKNNSIKNLLANNSQFFSNLKSTKIKYEMVPKNLLRSSSGSNQHKESHSHMQSSGNGNCKANANGNINSQISRLNSARYKGKSNNVNIYKKLSRVNSVSKIATKPLNDFFLNKIKAISSLNTSKKINYAK